jgi:hypothetical protein
MAVSHGLCSLGYHSAGTFHFSFFKDERTTFQMCSSGLILVMDRYVSWEYEGRLAMTWILSGFAVKEALDRSLIF